MMPNDPHPGLPRSLSIMLVEDDPDDVFLTTRVLKRLGIQSIDIVSDGFEALDRLTRRPHDVPLPDIVITDLNLPGISGLNIISRLRSSQDTRVIPSIILTSSIDPHHREACQELGNVGFLTKPPVPEMLAEAIMRAITGSLPR